MNCKLGGEPGYWLLKSLSKSTATATAEPAEPCSGRAKLERFLGRHIWREFANQRVLDFGCGEGAEAVAVAEAGARIVIGLEIQESRLELARRRAERCGVADRCLFINPLREADLVSLWSEQVDCAYSIDAFEHYDAPDDVLRQVFTWLAPGGKFWISFGPPWKNPFGCHMRFFTRCPWIHCLFREETIMRVRSLYRADGAQRFAEVEGGLNQMTLSRFLKLVRESSFEMDYFRPVAFSSRFVHRRPAWELVTGLPGLREYLTSVVLCRLVRPLAHPIEPAHRTHAAYY